MKDVPEVTQSLRGGGKPQAQVCVITPSRPVKYSTAHACILHSGNATTHTHTGTEHMPCRLRIHASRSSHGIDRNSVTIYMINTHPPSQAPIEVLGAQHA